MHEDSLMAIPEAPPSHGAAFSIFAGLTARRRTELARLGMTTAIDLLNWLPHRYEQFQNGIAIAEIKPGQLVTIQGLIVQTRLIRRRPLRFEALLEDPTGRCVLTWFNRRELAATIKPGTCIRAAGKVAIYKGRPQIVQPDISIVEDLEPTVKSDGIVPIYPASADISRRFIAELISRHLDACLAEVGEWFTEDFLVHRHLMTLTNAYRQLHKPESLAGIAQAQRTIAYHEIFLFQLALEIRRYHLRHSLSACKLRTDDQVDQRIRALLDFALTAAQNRVIGDLRKDLSRSQPMNRLLQGDVGSGKTVVALYAMLMAVAAGKQAALLAPTEILAEQHLLTIRAALSASRVQLELLTANTPPARRVDILQRLASGELNLLIGTHALLAEPVTFGNLAILVVDEQHKFGVEQRAHLRRRQANIHTLVMTATPIPRTLAMTYFGDLDVSLIDGLPPGRHPIHTRKVTTPQLPEVYRYMRDKIAAGRQAYVVTPAIEDGSLELASVTTVLGELAASMGPEIRIAPLHSRLTAEARRDTMERFRAGEIQVLVCTTIIEVGVDVPNASLMLIRQAERFGLAQLHQLRGRIGRSSHQSVCILASDDASDGAQARLNALVRHSSGFKIAEEDLKLRGMGEMVGTRQSGLPDFLFPEFLHEMPFLQMIRRDARDRVTRDPHLLAPEHAKLREQVFQRYRHTLLLADVA